MHPGQQAAYQAAILAAPPPAGEAAEGEGTIDTLKKFLTAGNVVRLAAEGGLVWIGGKLVATLWSTIADKRAKKKKKQFGLGEAMDIENPDFDDDEDFDEDLDGEDLEDEDYGEDEEEDEEDEEEEDYDEDTLLEAEAAEAAEDE